LDLEHKRMINQRMTVKVDSLIVINGYNLWSCMTSY